MSNICKKSATELTSDTLFDGRLVCQQPRHGYRFSVDAVLLAHFIQPHPADNILDLGAGCGVISLILSYCWPDAQLTGLELQHSLAQVMRRNIDLNNIAHRLRVLEGDLRNIRGIMAAGSFDQVVCNPPYYKCGTGRCNPDNEQAVARHEIMADMEDVVRAAAFAVRNRGLVSFIYPAERTAALFTCLRQHRLEPKRLQIVYGYPGGPGRLVMVESSRGGGEELRILPSLNIYTAPDNRQYSPEMAAFYAANLLSG